MIIEEHTDALILQAAGEDMQRFMIRRPKASTIRKAMGITSESEAMLRAYKARDVKP